MVESLTFCAVCFEAYDRESHTPLLMQCGHTFCQACLMLISDPMCCPHCRQKESRALSDLPKNILVYQIQAQLAPEDIPVCDHEDFYFYCKVCKYPLCVDCVVNHSSHGLISLKDPGLNDVISQHIEQIEGTYKARISQCKKRKEHAEKYLEDLEDNYHRNKEEITNKFEEMRRIVEAQEEQFLRQIGQLYQDIHYNNERNDNVHSSYRVDVKVDEEWLLSNLKKVGNIGIVNPNRQDLYIRRSGNVKALNWKYSGRIDALSFMVSKNVLLTGVGVCTPYKNGKFTNVDEFKVLKGDTTRDEVVYLHSSPTSIPADFHSGVFQVKLETLVPLESNSSYTVYFKLSGAKTFKCVDSRQRVEGRDNTIFLFKNTQFVSGDESNRTDVQCGPIADFYYVPENTEL